MLRDHQCRSGASPLSARKRSRRCSAGYFTGYRLAARPHQRRADHAGTGNLRAVLQQRLSATEIGSDTLHEVAALIDEAAQKIERLK